MAKIFFCIALLFLSISCSSDKEEIIGLWDVNAFMVGDSFEFEEGGTFEFEEDGILLIKKGGRIEKKKWLVEKGFLKIDKVKFSYKLSKNRLKLVFKSKQEIYIELIKK